MKAAVFNKAGDPFDICEYGVPSVGAGMARTDLVLSGVCGTDIHICGGYIGFTGPMILGHEYIGDVVELGEGPATDCTGASVAVGDLAAVNVIEACGTCKLCLEGGDASCLHLAETLTYVRSSEEAPHFHGGFAETNISPTRYLHKLPAGIEPDVAAAFLCGGPTVIRGLRYAGGIRPDDHVVVQGSGPVGLFAVLYARLAGAATVTMIGSGANPLRLELAAELGAGHVFDVRASTPAERGEAVKEITGGIGADLVIEGSGSPDAVPEGLGLLRARGRYVLAGQYSSRGDTPIPTHVITFNALQVFGSAQFSVLDREDYFAFLVGCQASWPVIRRVVTHRFDVAHANEAIDAARSGLAIKAVLEGSRP